MSINEYEEEPVSGEPLSTEVESDVGSEGVATGHHQVDAALAALAEVADAPPAEQVAPLAAAHEVLRETLDAIGRADLVK
jgi:hypothetical protein